MTLCYDTRFPDSTYPGFTPGYPSGRDGDEWLCTRPIYGPLTRREPRCHRDDCTTSRDAHPGAATCTCPDGRFDRYTHGDGRPPTQPRSCRGPHTHSERGSRCHPHGYSDTGTSGDARPWTFSFSYLYSAAYADHNGHASPFN